MRTIFIKSRKSNLIEYLKILRPIKYNDKKNYIINKLFCNVQSKIQYSYILNNGKIVPHTDEVAKLLSLMIYFPENEEKEKNYGTTFWECKYPNFKNEHLNNREQQELFLENSNKVFESYFEKNVLYGFVKNSKSWHSVEPINLHPHYVRKSININFFI